MSGRKNSGRRSGIRSFSMPSIGLDGRAAAPLVGATVERRASPSFFFQAEDGIRDRTVTGVQTCALPISAGRAARVPAPGVATAVAPAVPAATVPTAVASAPVAPAVGACVAGVGPVAALVPAAPVADAVARVAGARVAGSAPTVDAVAAAAVAPGVTAAVAALGRVGRADTTDEQRHDADHCDDALHRCPLVDRVHCDTTFVAS